ncbi:MAG: hypothetical protein KY410_08655, partial [Proteobacteria bacterium]|nr:hypothetical protein [Pseudomonadota bacterium]
TALDRRFGQIFPLETPDDRRRLELLREAYIAARYKKAFQVERADLDVLATHVQALRELVRQTGEALAGTCIAHNV